jgi:hypothetical protein
MKKIIIAAENILGGSKDVLGFDETAFGKWLKTKKNIMNTYNESNNIYIVTDFEQCLYWLFSINKVNVYERNGSDGYAATKNENCISFIIDKTVKKEVKKSNVKAINADILVGGTKNPVFIFNKETNSVYYNEFNKSISNLYKIFNLLVKFNINIAKIMHNSRAVRNIKTIYEKSKSLDREEAKEYRYHVVCGVDGELELVKNKRVVRATSNGYEGTDESCEIGADGSGDPLEIRPKPGSPKVLADNVHSLIKQIEDQVSARGNVFPIGCHMHFSVEGKKIKRDGDIAKLLDFYLGKNLVGLNGSQRGPQAYYGHYSDIRDQFHGGFEYRTPPSAILANKKFFRTVVTIGAAVVEKYVNREEFFVDLSLQATKEDYVALGMPEVEIEYFFESIKRLSNSKNKLFNINAAWTRQKRKV